MRILAKLLFGETWLVPVGLAVAVAAALVLRDVLGDEWGHAGGFVVLAGVVVVLVVSVARTARA